MKKKIIALSLALLLLAGSVSASSINGDYKGNPIVKVTSNGKQLETDEVPAMIYDGHTVVPISLLRQIGASVTWNGDTYNVDVKLDSPKEKSSQVNPKLFVKAVKDTLSQYGITVSDYSFNIDDKGAYIHVEYNAPASISNEQVENNLVNISTSMTAIDLQIDGMIIDVPGVLSAGIRMDDALDYTAGKLTKTQYENKWKIDSITQNQSSIQQQTPTMSISPETQKMIIDAKCVEINKKYDAIISEARNDAARRGLGKNSYTETKINNANDQRNKELKILGCSK